MAKHKYPWMALSKLLNAKTELTVADFDGLADITASAAEVNVVDGVTAGTVTASKAVIVGSDSAVSGMKRKVVGAPAGAVLTAAHSGNIYTNEGATGPAEFALGAATVGVELTFMVMDAQGLAIVPSGTETIALPSSGAQGGAGEYLAADAVGEWVTLLCVKTGQWQVKGYFGTWAHGGGEN